MQEADHQPIRHISRTQTKRVYFEMASRLFAVVFCLALSACAQNDQIKTDLDSLAERLESFTGIPIAEYEISALQAPAKHSLAKSIPDLQIALREFYAIDDCPLGQFIAQRNTALGKTQLPSTRFIYEARLLITLDKCMQQLSPEHPMYEQLQQWIAQKQQYLPSVWANMLTQSDEFYGAFTAAGGYISGTSSDGLSSTKLALRYMLDARNMDDIDSATLELHLRDLEGTRLPARMWRTQALFSLALPPMSEALNAYIDKHETTCNAAKKEELKIMRNIFTMFFADKIQPLASQLNHYQYQLNDSFKRLVENEHIPGPWAQYIESQYDYSAARYKEEMKRHIALWQQVFALCN